MNENDDDDDFVEGDYGFIINSDGELKSMMFPEKLMENPPTSVKKILKIFGIRDIQIDGNHTLH
jgi:hypothetical protein